MRIEDHYGAQAPSSASQAPFPRCPCQPARSLSRVARPVMAVIANAIRVIAIEVWLIARVWVIAVRMVVHVNGAPGFTVPLIVTWDTSKVFSSPLPVRIARRRP